MAYLTNVIFLIGGIQVDQKNSEQFYTVKFANQLWLEKKNSEAWKLFFRAINCEPSNPQLLFHLGTLSHQALEYEKAIRWFSLAIAQGASNPRLYNNLGESFRVLGKLHAAMKCFKKAIALDPGLAQLHNNLGLVQVALGALSEAENSFMTAISLSPNYCLAQRNLARVLQDQCRRDGAAEQFHKSRVNDPWPPNLVAR
jgi:protein O-GlcNAc transferase